MSKDREEHLNYFWNDPSKPIPKHVFDRIKSHLTRSGHLDEWKEWCACHRMN